MAFEQLVKEIDVLTYNARSVMNALIRSVLRYGTSDGYSVVRAGEKITLSRNDIYLLYRLYTEWASLGYDEDKYETAVSQVRKNFMSADEDEGTVDEAVIKHSKIMYMNSENKGSDSEYWLNKIIQAVDKSMILNSSPIPVNLRTPVFDENMATTKYNQYETYLLPIGYYMQAILGYGGDGIDHTAGGKNWTFEVDNRFKVLSSCIELGKTDNTSRYTLRNAAGLTNNNTTTYSLVYGYNTKSLGYANTVGGHTNFILGADRSHNLSTESLIEGDWSGIIGGQYNRIYIAHGGTAGGEDLVILSHHGFAANKQNSVGYDGMWFTVPDLSSTDNSCVVTIDKCASSTEAVQTKYNPKNIVRIYISDNGQYPFGMYNLQVGDVVILYDQTINGDNYLRWNGIEFAYQTATITGIQTTGTYHDIILSENVKYSEYGVNGGRIAPYRAKGAENPYGIHSTALNYMNQAIGTNQTVVGMCNYPVRSPEFVVGCGYIPGGNIMSSRYIHGAGYIDSTVYRQNNFLVDREYLVGSIGSYIEFGMVKSGTGNREGMNRWINTSDLASHGEMYFEFTEGTTEYANNTDYDENPDTTDYGHSHGIYHTNHIGLSNTKMSIGRYTNRREYDNILGAINFYDKDWFDNHNDVDSQKRPRNTVIEIIAQNGVRENKSNMNITNGFVTPKGYICNTRYAEEGSYGVWLDNPLSNACYYGSEYILVSAANTISMYSTESIYLKSKSIVRVDASHFEINANTHTFGSLALTGNGRSHTAWFDGDLIRSMRGGILALTPYDLHAQSYQTSDKDGKIVSRWTSITRDGKCWGYDEYRDGNVSAHVISSVGASHDAGGAYRTSLSHESVKLFMPGPQKGYNPHPFIARYKEQVGSQAEVLQVNKLAWLDDVYGRPVISTYNNNGTGVFIRICVISLSPSVVYDATNLTLDLSWVNTTTFTRSNTSRVSLGFRGDWNTPSHSEYPTNPKIANNCSASFVGSCVRLSGTGNPYPVFLAEWSKATGTLAADGKTVAATSKATYALYAYVPGWCRGFNVRIVDASGAYGDAKVADTSKVQFDEIPRNINDSTYNDTTVVKATSVYNGSDQNTLNFNYKDFVFFNNANSTSATFGLSNVNHRLLESYEYVTSMTYSKKGTHDFSLNGTSSTGVWKSDDAGDTDYQVKRQLYKNAYLVQ